MIYLAHAGEEHVTTNEGFGHIVSENLLAFLAVTAVFVGLIVLVAYKSRPKITTKQKDVADE